MFDVNMLFATLCCAPRGGLPRVRAGKGRTVALAWSICKMFGGYGESKHRGGKHPSEALIEDESISISEGSAVTSSATQGLLLRAPSASKQRKNNHAALAAFFLAILAVENTASMLARRYAVGVLKLQFSKNAVLFVNELMKLAFSVAMEWRRVNREGGRDGVSPVSPRRLFRPKGGLRGHLKRVARHSPRMAVPAIVYLIVNLISYPALARINASVFTAISQLKVLATAFFAVIMLRTPVSVRKWRTLTVMVMGVVLVSWESAPTNNVKSIDGNVATSSSVSPEYAFGVLCAGVQTMLSGFGSIYFELMLKQKGVVESNQSPDSYQFSVWDRNIQLALYSCVIYFPMAWVETGGLGILSGWTPLVWGIACLHASGGILVALSVFYTSSVTKTVAVCASLVLTTFLGHEFSDAPLNGAIVIGCAVVILSVFGYRDDCAVDEALGKNHR